MTPLVLITTHNLHVRRVVTRTISQAYWLDRNVPAEEFHRTLEYFRINGQYTPPPIPGQRAFSSLVHQLTAQAKHIVV